MKLDSMELPLAKNNTPKIVVQITLTLIVLAIIPLSYPLLGYPLFLLKNSCNNSSDYSQSSSPSSHDSRREDLIRALQSEKRCDIFRPDTDFMKWRWKPDGCDLPIFNPAQFLKIVRGKSLAFIGDSVARNQMQSLICLLSRTFMEEDPSRRSVVDLSEKEVEYPVDVLYMPDERFKRWKYTTYNFTLANYWSPHLVKAKEADSNGPTETGLFNDLYLDEFDETTQVEDFGYIVISAGHWFFRQMILYENNQVVGCRYCLKDNVTDFPISYGYRKAFRTAFKAINSLENFKGITFLRTFAPSHFENGLWNQGGDCVRTKPFRSNETSLEGTDFEFYMTQLEEFRIAEKQGNKRGLKFRLLDTTQATLLRPDGHPSRYGHLKNENVTMHNDCVHWCLPGPIDTWSDFLLEMLKMEDNYNVS
ncbi:hypothetical protein QYF36_016515 [Acer negundo]|nr:hypothetical protein QYF36_016515 [Acer negundo]